MKMLLRLFKIFVFLLVATNSAYGQTFTLCDPPVEVNLSIQGDGENFQWSISDGEISSQGRTATASVIHEGIYEVYVKFESNKCDYQITGKFFVDSCLKWNIWVPNAISPNGVNITWLPKGERIRIDMISIYDRWGHLAWSGSGAFEGYDYQGNELDGVFTYVLDFTELIKNTRQQVIGSITIVR